MALSFLIPTLTAIAAMLATKSNGRSGIIVPSKGRLSSRFGIRKHPVTGVMKLHKGLDIAIPTGTKIVSVYDGVVLKSTADDVSGNYVKIDHGRGIETLYMHLSRRDIQQGEQIKKGQQVGLSGATGRVTGPHLHFETRKDGKPFDPLKVIPEALFSL